MALGKISGLIVYRSGFGMASPSMLEGRWKSARCRPASTTE